MLCFDCQKKEASTKIGSSEGSILKAMIGKKCWNKKEIYLCKQCYKKRLNKLSV